MRSLTSLFTTRPGIAFLICTGIVTVGALIAYAMNSSSDSPPRSALGAVSVVAKLPATEGALPIEGTNVSTTTSLNKTAIEEMRLRFQSTDNYAAFIQEAMVRPLEGGRFYSMLAYHRCRDVSGVNTSTADVKAKSSEAVLKAVAAIADLQRRCAGVLTQYQDEMAFTRAVSDPRGGLDPLLGERGLKPPSKDWSARDLDAARNTGDPYSLAVALETNIEFLADQIDPAFSAGQNRTVLYSAASAASCEIVGSCKDIIHTAAPCALAGNCQYVDFRDYLRAGLDPEFRGLFDNAKTRLVQLVARR